MVERAAIALASLPAFIAEARASGQAFRLNSWRAPEGRRHNYLEWILTRDSHVKEVKLFALAPLVLSRYRALYEKFYREDRLLAIRRTALGLGLGALRCSPSMPPISPWPTRPRTPASRSAT